MRVRAPRIVGIDEGNPSEGLLSYLAPLSRSLIGKEVEVSPSTALPKAHRLMLGDHSQVDLA